MEVVQIALLLGISASLATTVWGINGGGRWLSRQIKAVIAMWRTRKQMQADIKTLQEQVVALTRRSIDDEYTAIKGIADLQLALEELQNTLTQLQTEATETKEVRDGQARVNSYLKGFCEDLEQRLIVLQQQVKDLDKGGWLRLGKQQDAPR